ncbi:hypothetical protein VBZ51_08260 [Maribacter sp. HS]|uniref:hypothetical protein n=1 Tax=Maribacter sp. HS TaxID=3110480 RepID=UPI003A873BAF
MYNDIFAIDEIPLNKRQESDEPANPYLLNNYSFFEPKLDKELYYNYFLRTVLFDIDIMELDDFLNFQFGNSKNPERLIKVIEYKVIPDIDLIISTASIGGNGMFLGYNEEIEREYGFVETDGTIKNKLFDIQVLKALTVSKNLESNLKKRKLILENTPQSIKEGEIALELNKLKWIGKPSHLAMIIRELANQGYIEMPLKQSGDPYPSEITRQIQSSFIIDRGAKFDSIVRYSNSDDEKHEKLKQNFMDKGFEIPNSKIFE